LPSRRGPVKAERSEPQGSLDGVPRCNTFKEEEMAGMVSVRSSFFSTCGRKEPAVALLPIRSLVGACSWSAASWGPRFSGCCQLKIDLGFPRVHLGEFGPQPSAQSPRLGDSWRIIKSVLLVNPPRCRRFVPLL
jgi:hypothetical protein